MRLVQGVRRWRLLPGAVQLASATLSNCTMFFSRLLQFIDQTGVETESVFGGQVGPSCPELQCGASRTSVPLDWSRLDSFD